MFIFPKKKDLPFAKISLAMIPNSRPLHKVVALQLVNTDVYMAILNWSINLNSY